MIISCTKWISKGEEKDERIFIFLFIDGGGISCLCAMADFCRPIYWDKSVSHWDHGPYFRTAAGNLFT